MTGKEYQVLAMRTNDDKYTNILNNLINSEGCSDNFDDDIKIGELINATLGLFGEAGELSEYIQKGVFHDFSFDKKQLINGLGDIMWYVAQCCNSLNISLDDVMQSNINKLKERHPDGYTNQY